MNGKEENPAVKKVVAFNLIRGKGGGRVIQEVRTR